jgi:hypothetical protein
MARGRRQWRWPELCGEDGLGRVLLSALGGGSGMEETASTGELAMMAGMALTPIAMARAGGGLGDGSSIVAGLSRRLGKH